MPYPKHRAPSTLSTPIGVLICIPPELLPAMRGALWGLQYNYGWVSDTGDVPGAKRAFVDAIEDIDMACCGAIADCIEGALGDNPTEGQRALLGALRDFLDTNSESSPGSGATSGIESLPPIVPSVPGCDNDVLFGAVTGMVDLIHTTIVDMLETLDAQAQLAARLSLMISALPGVGEFTPLDEMLALAQQLVSQFKANYDSAYSALLRDEYRCDLFCDAKSSGCELTWETAGRYFADRAVAEIFQIDVQDIVEYLLNGTFSGEEYVHALSYFVVAMWSSGSSVFGVTRSRVNRVVASMQNDPDSDWSTLCDPCGDRTCYDMADLSGLSVEYGLSVITEGNPPPSIESGVWTDATVYPYSSNANNAFRRAAAIKVDLGADVLIEDVSFDFKSSFNSSAHSLGISLVGVAVDAADGTSVYRNQTVETQPSWGNYQASLNVTGRHLWVWVGFNTDASGATGIAWIDNLCVRVS